MVKASHPKLDEAMESMTRALADLNYVRDQWDYDDVVSDDDFRFLEDVIGTLGKAMDGLDQFGDYE